MALEEKLKIFREKISNATTFDNNFKQLLGIELFDFIHENNILKNEFYRRVDYLKKLATDKSFRLLQDNLFKTIQKILKLTSLKEVEKWQKELNNINVKPIPNNLKTRRHIDKNKEKYYLTLPEAYLELQNKDAYYRLGDKSTPYSIQDISFDAPVLPLINQYKETVENFFEYLLSNIKDEKRCSQLNKLIEEYNEYFYKLDELIYRIPIKLHLKDFEGFFLNCVRFYQRKGYELYHEYFKRVVENKTGREFNKIKENALVVIDDLIDLIKGSPVTKIEIVKGMEGLQDGLKAIAKTKKEDKNKFPYKLPAGTKWEDFIIKFEDDENIFIRVKQFKHYSNYKEMGMIGRGKNPSPSEAWRFMKVLAQLNGELTIRDTEARDKYKKQKELLTKALQNYFSLDYDPFYPYRSSSEKQGNSYKIKITLIPPTTSNNETAVTEEDDDLGIQEYLREHAPQIYEDQ
jgi:hypothetical protein